MSWQGRMRGMRSTSRGRGILLSPASASTWTWTWTVRPRHVRPSSWGSVQMDTVASPRRHRLHNLGLPSPRGQWRHGMHPDQLRMQRRLFLSTQRPMANVHESSEGTVQESMSSPSSTLDSGASKSISKSKSTSEPPEHHGTRILQRTHDILHHVHLGSMTPSQIRDATALLHHHAKSHTSYKSTKTAELLLERLIAEGSDGNNPAAHQAITPRLYNAIMDAYARTSSHSRHAARDAEQLMERMCNRHEYYLQSIVAGDAMGDDMQNGAQHGHGNGNGNDSGNHHGNGMTIIAPPAPDIVTYNSLLNVWCNSRHDGMEAVSKAEQILSFLENDDEQNHRERERERGPGPGPVRPDNITYNIMMNTYANQIHEYGYAQKSEDILLRMTALQKDAIDADSAHDTEHSPGHGISPNTLSFNIVLKAWKNSGGGIESAQRAEEILRLMVKLYNDGHDNLQPDHVSFQTVLHAYGNRVGDVGDGGRILAMEILDSMEGVLDLMMDHCRDRDRDRHDNGDGDGDGEPPRMVMIMVMEAVNQVLEMIAKCSRTNSQVAAEAATRADRILDKMTAKMATTTAEHHHGHDSIVMSYTYTHLMNCYLAHAKSTHKAHTLLNDLMEGNTPSPPSTYCLNAILHYFHRTQNIDAAETLMDGMLSLKERHGWDVAPDIVTYNVMADLYFRNREDDSFGKIWNLFQRMEEALDRGEIVKDHETMRDPFVYEITIKKLSNCPNVKMRGRALEVLKKMVQRYDEGILLSPPGLTFYNIVLSILANEKSKDSAKQAMELLQSMEDMALKDRTAIPLPDAFSYNHVMVAMTRNMNEETPEKMLKLVDRMEQRDKELRSQSKEHLLNTIVYETVLQGLVHPRFGNAELADDMIRRIIGLEESGHPNVSMTPRCLNLSIKAYCQNRKVTNGEMVAFGAHRYVMSFVNKFNNGSISILPSKLGFNTLLNCWAETKHWKSYLKALEIYDTMQRLSQNASVQELGTDVYVDVAPDAYTASLLLRIFTKQISNPKVQRKAYTFINALDWNHLDTHACNSMLTLLAKSKPNHPIRLQMARKLLLDMQQRGLADTTSYNTMLNVCAFSKEPQLNLALSTARETYKELLTFVRPNELSFALAMKSCNNLTQIQDEKELNLAMLFRDACVKGFVGKHVVKELNYGIPSARRRKELLGDSLNGKLDKKWTRFL